MRTYRGIWGAAMVLALAVAALGSRGLGVWNVVGASAMLAGLGVTFGLSWAEGPHRWRLVARCALWFGLAGLLLVGIPTALGNWSLLALPALAGTAPPIVEWALGCYLERRPARPGSDPRRLSDRDLRRRWRHTAEELRRRGTPPATALRLVQERQLLLDEIERRDPAEFEAQLVRTGWHSTHPAVDL